MGISGFIVRVYVHVCATDVHAPARVHMWKSEDNFVELSSSELHGGKN